VSNPQNPGIYLVELERMIGRPRGAHWSSRDLVGMNQKKLISTDDARMYLTADCDGSTLEDSYKNNLQPQAPQSGRSRF
jgi:hypothetical protein